MRRILLAFMLALALGSATAERYGVQLRDPHTGSPLLRAEASALLARHDLRIVTEAGAVAGVYLVEETRERPLSLQKRDVAAVLEEEPRVAWAEAANAVVRHKRAAAGGACTNRMCFADPLYAAEWYLHGTGAAGGTPDVHLEGVWARGLNGSGVLVSIVDDGVQYDHPDIRAKYVAEASWDFNRNAPDPLPQSAYDSHGTRCAGVASAAANDFCGVGVAYGSSLAAVRLLGDAITEIQESAALSYRSELVDVYSNSWGPSDDGRTLEGPSALTNLTLSLGTRNGRGGKGSVFVFAAGNGGEGDGCNFDGRRAGYQEVCSAQLVTMYSGGGGQYVHTTSANQSCASPPCCYDYFSGTSASAPMLAGFVALVLQARPDFAWRDVQDALARTALVTDAADADWSANGAGLPYNHYYGFGRVDAARTLAYAERAPLLPATQDLLLSPPLVVPPARGSVAMGGAAAVFTHEFARADFASASHLTSIESVEVVVTLSAPVRGQIRIELVSPAGTVSVLANRRPADTSAAGFEAWTFTSVRHWGEAAEGAWTLRLSDARPMVRGSSLAMLRRWQLRIRGTCASQYRTTSVSGNVSAPVYCAAGEYADGYAGVTRLAIALGLCVTLGLLGLAVGLYWRHCRQTRGEKTRPTAIPLSPLSPLAPLKPSLKAEDEAADGVRNEATLSSENLIAATAKAVE